MSLAHYTFPSFSQNITEKCFLTHALFLSFQHSTDTTAKYISTLYLTECMR